MCVYNTWTAITNYKKARTIRHQQGFPNFNYVRTLLEDVAFANPLQISANLWMSSKFWHHQGILYFSYVSNLL